MPCPSPTRTLDFGKLAWAIARSPGKISGLLRLQKHTQFAAQQLATVLAEITSSVVFRFGAAGKGFSLACSL